MLHREYAEMLLERQLAATDWIDHAPPPGSDLRDWHAFRNKLKDLRARGAWNEMATLEPPKRQSGLNRRP